MNKAEQKSPSWLFNYSALSKVLRIAGRVFSFIQKCRNKVDIRKQREGTALALRNEKLDKDDVLMTHWKVISLLGDFLLRSLLPKSLCGASGYDFDLCPRVASSNPAGDHLGVRYLNFL